jgi:hypothetical protein
MPYIAALDPGKTKDPAALAVLEQVEGTDPLVPGRPCWHYTLCGLESYPLGTPYTTIAGQVGVGERVKERFAGPPLQGSMVGVDATGVGSAVVDLLRSLNPSCALVAVVITGGEAFRREGFTWHVAKRLLVSNFVSLTHSGRFRVPDVLPMKKQWDAQLAAFREKQRPSGSLSWESEKESDHDDLVLAAMIAAWLGERSPPLRRGDIGMGRRVVSRMPAGAFLPGKMPRRW